MSTPRFSLFSTFQNQLNLISNNEFDCKLKLSPLSLDGWFLVKNPIKCKGTLKCMGAIFAIGNLVPNYFY